MIHLPAHVLSRYTLVPLGTGTVVSCDPCELHQSEGGRDPHWAAVRGMGDAAAWVNFHELRVDHGDESTPIADSIVPDHRHQHYDDNTLYGVVLGHGRDAVVWPYNDDHAANIISRKLGGVVVALPVIADHRSGRVDNPVSKLAATRDKFGPCPGTHPAYGECLAFDGHMPRTHMSELGAEWTDADLNVSRETSPDDKRHNAAAERFAADLGQALSGALGIPIRVLDEATGREVEYGPHSPVQPVCEPVTPADTAADIAGIVAAAFPGMMRPAEPAEPADPAELTEDQVTNWNEHNDHADHADQDEPEPAEVPTA